MSLFLSLDGIDGTGKSTQCRLLADWLREQGHLVTACADPGGTPIGDHLRALVLGRQFAIAPETEALLFLASRAELVRRVIRPALDAGHVVVSDRYVLANIVYQGHAGGLDLYQLRDANHLSTGGVMPDLTVVLDLPVDRALQRRKRKADRMESRGADYFERVRAGFLAEAARDPDRIHVIDASIPIADVQAAIRSAVAARLP